MKMGNFVEWTSKFVIGSLEEFFYQWGKFVARHPLKVIPVCVLVTGLCMIGFKDFRSVCLQRSIAHSLIIIFTSLNPAELSRTRRSCGCPTTAPTSSTRRGAPTTSWRTRATRASSSNTTKTS